MSQLTLIRLGNPTRRFSPALCMLLFMVSFGGLPPLAGFSAKFYLLGVLIQNGSWWWWLVGVIGINTVLSLYYYARVVQTDGELAWGSPIWVTMKK